MTDTLIERLRIPMDTELRKFEEVYDEERSEAADRLEAMQEALETARGAIVSLRGIVSDSTVTNSFVTLLNSEATNKSGQPLPAFAKEARRAVNESRAVICQIDTLLERKP